MKETNLFVRSASEYCAFKKCSKSFLLVELETSKGSELALYKIITFEVKVIVFIILIYHPANKITRKKYANITYFLSR